LFSSPIPAGGGGPKKPPGKFSRTLEARRARLDPKIFRKKFKIGLKPIFKLDARKKPGTGAISMRITESRVRQIIREEVRVINKAIKNEGFLDTVKGFFGGGKEDASKEGVPYFASETTPGALSKEKINDYIRKNYIGGKLSSHFEEPKRSEQSDTWYWMDKLAYTVIKKKYFDVVEPPPFRSVMKDMAALIIATQTAEEKKFNTYSADGLQAARKKAINSSPSTWPAGPALDYRSIR